MLLRKKTSINEDGKVVEPDYCPICYDSEIQLAPKEITDNMTFEFTSCEHRFCKECCRMDLKLKIEEAKIEKLVCPQSDCGKRVLTVELEQLFKKDDPEVLEKFERFREKKLEESDPLLRFCTKPGCEGKMRGENMQAKELTCPDCGTKICFQCREEAHGKLTCE